MKRHYSSSPDQGRFAPGILVFSVSLVALIGVGLGLNYLLGRGGDEEVALLSTTGSGRSTTSIPAPVVETSPAPGTPSVPETPQVEVVIPEPVLRVVTYAEAESVFMERRYDDATDLFLAYTERRPGNAWGHYMLGLSAWKAGRLDQAESGFETAIRIDPGHLKSRLNLTRVLLDDGRPGEAEVQVSLAAELDPDDGQVQRLRGRAYHNLGRVDEAVSAYRRAAELDGEDVWAMNNLGLLLIEQERFEEALPPLARAAGLRAENPIFQNNLGIALERTGHYRSAADAFRAALGADDTSPKVAANLARVEDLTPTEVVEPVNLDVLAERFAAELNTNEPRQELSAIEP